MKKILNESMVKYISVHMKDGQGEVLETDNSRIFLRIREGKVNDVLELFNSGMIHELVEEKMVPNIWISEDYCMDDKELLLEMERIECVIYPNEWSFHMLKEAAKRILDVSQIALKYGYQLNGINTYDIIFKGSHPLYVDFGGFRKISKNFGRWDGTNEFLINFYFPLRLWSNHYNLTTIARKSIGHSEISIEEWFDFFYRPRFWAKLVWKCYFRGLWCRSVCRQYILKENISQQKQRYYKEYNKLHNKIDKLEQIGTSLWANYQDEYTDNNDPEKLNRFTVLSDLLSGIDIEQSLEIAGNRGGFSKLLLERNIVKRAIVTDYDRFAIDKCFIDNFADGRDNAIEDIYSALINVMDATELGNIPRHERLKSDIVIALAITHHLILAQDISLGYIFETLAQYTSKYILIEFMPLGLWYKGIKTDPYVPSWYTLDWFKKEMSIKFDIIAEKQTEINRIALLGKLK